MSTSLPDIYIMYIFHSINTFNKKSNMKCFIIIAKRLTSRGLHLADSPLQIKKSNHLKIGMMNYTTYEYVWEED